MRPVESATWSSATPNCHMYICISDYINYMYIYIHTYIQTYIHIHIYIIIYTHPSRSVLSPDDIPSLVVYTSAFHDVHTTVGWLVGYKPQSTCGLNLQHNIHICSYIYNHIYIYMYIIIYIYTCNMYTYHIYIYMNHKTGLSQKTTKDPGRSGRQAPNWAVVKAVVAPAPWPWPCFRTVSWCTAQYLGPGRSGKTGKVGSWAFYSSYEKLFPWENTQVDWLIISFNILCYYNGYFRNPNLEVPTFFLVGLFFRPKISGNIPTKYGQKYGTNVPPCIGSWRSPIEITMVYRWYIYS